MLVAEEQKKLQYRNTLGCFDAAIEAVKDNIIKERIKNFKNIEKSLSKINNFAKVKNLSAGVFPMYAI